MATLSQNVKQVIHDFDDIKDAIEYKGVDVPTGTPTSEYSDKIRQIEKGVFPEGQLTIQNNGIYNVKTYESVDVEVSQPAGTIDITNNGIADVNDYQYANVQVPQPSGTISIDTNGEYDITNYQYADVEVPLPDGTINITVNGIASVNDYEYADVNVVDPLGDFIRTNFTTIEIPDRVTTISADTFKDYTNLETVVIPDSVTSIGENAFYGCINLTTINGGCFVTNSVNAFYGCPSTLETGGTGQVRYSTYNNKLSIGGNGMMGNYTSTSTLPWGEAITSIIIEDGVTNIGNYAFYNCSSLTEITISDSVTSIGNRAFSYCTDLTNITGANEVTSIGEYAFLSCTSLKSIDIPNSVTSTGYSAFYNCTGLTNVTIPDSVTSISAQTFAECTGLTSVTIPDSVTSIGGAAFRDCTSLPSVTIPNSVTSIGGAAFYGCSGLTNITIPDSVTSIGGNAFNNTQWYNNQPNGLVYAGKVVYRYKGSMPDESSIVLQDGTKGIAEWVFSKSSLKSITIPDSVTNIGYEAFYACSYLTDVYYTGTEEQWNSITIGAENTRLLNATIHYNYVSE